MALLLRRRPASVADGEDTPALSQVEEARLQVLLKDE
jgi:cytochrome c-type biogenesis protein CcmH